MMKQQLSILIPTYNNPCVAMVRQLLQQAETIEGLSYEVVVTDDASTDASVVAQNQSLRSLPHTVYIELEHNVGRAAIRNRLVQAASYPWLLFIDSGMGITPDLLRRYLSTPGELIYGGYRVEGDARQLRGNLRYLYEKHAEPHHIASRRQQHPYRDFHASNFLVSRTIMLQHPFNEQFRHYGYEDVLLGKQFEVARIPVTHIDNPVLFNEFESNQAFLTKTEEGLRTLHAFRNELRGHSRLLAITAQLRRLHLASLLLPLFKHTKNGWKRQLLGSHPSLYVFTLYKTGYLLQLENL